MLESRPGKIVLKSLAAAGEPIAKARFGRVAGRLSKGATFAEAYTAYKDHGALGVVQVGIEQGTVATGSAIGALWSPANPVAGRAIGQGITTFGLEVSKELLVPTVTNYFVSKGVGNVRESEQKGINADTSRQRLLQERQQRNP